MTVESVKSPFGKALARLRVNKLDCMNLREFAQFVEYSVGHQSEIERGKKSPSPAYVSNLINRLAARGVPLGATDQLNLWQLAARQAGWKV